MSEFSVETLCTKCGKAPKASGHEWCKKCKLEAEHQYREHHASSAEKRGYVRGVEEMRTLLVRAFVQVGGNGSFTQDEIARLIAQAPGPQWSASEPN
jgi:hypothetical protein